MLGHLTKLVWNRKRSNLLLMLEIFLAFLVVFAVTTAGLFLWVQYDRPLGFDYENLWAVSVSRPDEDRGDAWAAGDAATFRRVMQEVDSLEPVLSVGAASNRPYIGSISSTTWKTGGRQIDSEVGWGSDGLRDALQLELLAGRWFEADDSALDWAPIVINEPLARELYGDEDPLGRLFGSDDETEGARVVGVIRDYRHIGEFARSGSYFFRRVAVDGDDDVPVHYLLVRLAPGTPAAFEETLTRRLHAAAPDWSYRVQPLELARKDYFLHTLVPLAIVGTVAAFLLAMVVLGLTGVLWQNVTRRRRELGLRRAVGASRSTVHLQVVAEVMITAAFGLILGVVVAIQLPALGPFSFVPFRLVLISVSVSAFAMVVLAGACGLYPGWTATRIHPAEALRYE